MISLKDLLPKPQAATPSVSPAPTAIKMPSASSASSAQPQAAASPLSGLAATLAGLKQGTAGTGSKAAPAVAAQVPQLDLASIANLDLANLPAPESAQPPSMPSPQQVSAAYHYKEQAEQVEDAVTKSFYEHMRQLVESFGTTDLFQTQANCIQYLQDHKHLSQILKPEDIQFMVRALRQTYASTFGTKIANKTKRTASTSKLNEINDLLGDLF